MKSLAFTILGIVCLFTNSISQNLYEYPTGNITNTGISYIRTNKQGDIVLKNNCGYYYNKNNTTSWIKLTDDARIRPHHFEINDNHMAFGDYLSPNDFVITYDLDLNQPGFGQRFGPTNPVSGFRNSIQSVGVNNYSNRFFCLTYGFDPWTNSSYTFQYTDDMSGLTWQAGTLSHPIQGQFTEIADFFFESQNIGWFAHEGDNFGNNSGIYKTINNGVLWQKKINIGGNITAFTGEVNGNLYYSLVNNNDSSQNAIYSFDPITLVSTNINFGIPIGTEVTDLIYDTVLNRLWAETSNGVFFRDNLGVWQSMHVGFINLYGVPDIEMSVNGMICSRDGSLYEFDGTQWQFNSNTPNCNFGGGAYFNNDNEIIALGGTGVLYHNKANQTWTTAIRTDTIRFSSFSSLYKKRNKFYFLRNNENYVSNNGYSFTLNNNLVPIQFYNQLFNVTSDNMYSVIDNTFPITDSLFYSTDDGLTWIYIDSIYLTSLHLKIEASKSDRIYMYYQDPGFVPFIRYSADLGNTWVNLDSLRNKIRSNNIVDLKTDNSENLYALTDRGVLYSLDTSTYLPVDITPNYSIIGANDECNIYIKEDKLFYLYIDSWGNGDQYLYEYEISNQTWSQLPLTDSNNNILFVKNIIFDTAASPFLITDDFKFYSLTNYSSIKKNNRNTKKMSIYPNPSNGTFNFSSIEPINKIEVFNVSGKHIKTEYYNSKNGDFTLKDIEKGIFIIKSYFSENSIKYSKIILK